MSIVPDSIEKRCPPEPDLLCRFSDGESVAFELKKICSEILEKGCSDSLKSGDQDGLFFRGDEKPEEEKIKEAFKKHYVTEHPVELLFYPCDASFTFPGNVIPYIQECSHEYDHDFRRVWYMGGANDPCKCVFSVVTAGE